MTALVQRSRGRAAFDGTPTVPPQGLAYIASGVTTTALTFLDMVLPTGYDWFRLELREVSCTLPVNLAVCMCFSTDGGATFIFDADNFDQYRNYSHYFGAVATQVSDGGYCDFDYNAYIGGWMSDDALGGASGTINSIIDFDPGSSARLASFYEHSFTIWPADTVSNVVSVVSSVALNVAATIPIVPARVNLLRFLPYSNPYDLGSGATINPGFTYGLWGYKP